MDTFLSILLLFVVVAIVWAIAKFVLKLTTRIIGCSVTALVVVGLLFIVLAIVLAEVVKWHLGSGPRTLEVRGTVRCVERHVAEEGMASVPPDETQGLTFE